LLQPHYNILFTVEMVYRQTVVCTEILRAQKAGREMMGDTVRID
jgi:hypothetical protein